MGRRAEGNPESSCLGFDSLCQYDTPPGPLSPGLSRQRLAPEEGSARPHPRAKASHGAREPCVNTWAEDQREREGGGVLVLQHWAGSSFSRPPTLPPSPGGSATLEKTKLCWVKARDGRVSSAFDGRSRDPAKPFCLGVGSGGGTREPSSVEKGWDPPDLLAKHSFSATFPSLSEGIPGLFV